MSATDQIEDMFDEADYARKEAVAMKRKREEERNDESDDDNNQDGENIGDMSLDKQQRRVTAISGSASKQIVAPASQPTIDEQLEEIGVVNAQEAENKAVDEPVQKKPNKSEVDPEEFMEIKPKKLKSGVPEIIGYNEDDDSDDEESNQRKMIAEAFADDDVLEDFAKEKAALIEATKPKDVDTFLPGWGSWGGEGIKVNKHKKNRWLFKAPPPAKRRDDHKSNLIVNVDKDKIIRQHQVSQIPRHFNSVSDFEASIRAPIGDTFIPRTAHLKLIQPRVTTKMGRVIEPMNKSSLLKKNQEVIQELKLFQQESFEDKKGDDPELQN